MASVGCGGARQRNTHYDGPSLLEARTPMGPPAGLDSRHNRHSVNCHFTRRVAGLCMDADPDFRDLDYHALALSLGPDSLDFGDVTGHFDLSGDIRYLPLRDRREAKR